MTRLLQITLVLAFALMFVLLTSYRSSVVGQSNPVNPANSSVTEAVTGFDDGSNGFAADTHDGDRATFEEHETFADGLGPLFNADSCAACHSNPVTGAISQVTELRAGHFDGRNFVDH